MKLRCAAAAHAQQVTVYETCAPSKSDLRNHQAIVQPRLYDCLMVTQITLERKKDKSAPRDYSAAGVPDEALRPPWQRSEGYHGGGFKSCGLSQLSVAPRLRRQP